MAIFKAKEKYEDRVAQVEQMSEQEYENYKKTNFARKKKIATGWLIGSIVATAALFALVGITGAIWGWQLYQVNFALTTAITGGAISSIVSGFFRRHYKRELKVQKLVKEREQARTLKGRNLDTQKQTQKDNQIVKRVAKLQKARKITAREAKEYTGGETEVLEKSKMSSEQKKKAVREAVKSNLSQVKSNRDNMAFGVKNDWIKFKQDELKDYEQNSLGTGCIEVLFQDFDEDGHTVLNSEGDIKYKAIFAIDSHSDIELMKSNAVIYENLAKSNIDFPLKIRTTLGSDVSVKTYGNKEELEKDKNIISSDTEEFLKEHKKESEKTEEQQKGPENSTQTL